MQQDGAGAHCCRLTGLFYIYSPTGAQLPPDQRHGVGNASRRRAEHRASAFGITAIIRGNETPFPEPQQTAKVVASAPEAERRQAGLGGTAPAEPARSTGPQHLPASPLPSQQRRAAHKTPPASPPQAALNLWQRVLWRAEDKSRQWDGIKELSEGKKPRGKGIPAGFWRCFEAYKR